MNRKSVCVAGCEQAEWSPSHGKRGADYTEAGGAGGDGTHSVKDTVRAGSTEHVILS